MHHPMWTCPTCGPDAELEQPPCIDGHGEDGGECPEWACVQCGTAVLSGDLAPAASTVLLRVA